MPPKPDVNKSGGGGSGGNTGKKGSGVVVARNDGKGTIRQRQSSSDGESPAKPPAKKATAAGGGGAVAKSPVIPPGANTNNEDIMAAIQRLESKMERKFEECLGDQQKFRTGVEARLKNLEKSINDTITAECKSVREDLQIDIQVLTDRVNSVDTSVRKMKSDMEKEISDLRARLSVLESTNEAAGPFSPINTIVATGIRYTPGEDLVEKAQKLVSDGLGLELDITAAMWTPFRRNRPGIVKIQFACKEDKEQALEKRFDLKKSQDYKRVYIRSSMSHVERLVHLNSKILLQASGTEKDYQILGSGHVVKKEDFHKWFGDRQGDDAPQAQVEGRPARQDADVEEAA